MAFVTSGCATPAANVEVHVLLVNHADAAATVLAKAWDHDGRLVYNTSMDVAPLDAATAGADGGWVSGPAPSYGAPYSWFAHAGELTQQLDKDPAGVKAWQVHVYADRIEFVFCATEDCGL